MPRVLGLGGLVSTFWSRVLLPGKLEAGGGPGGGGRGRWRGVEAAQGLLQDP